MSRNAESYLKRGERTKVSFIFKSDTRREAIRKRTLPEPDLFATCPNDGKILEFYSGQFESVYVLLHPFIRTTSIDPGRFCPETYPSKTEILEGCVAVGWREIVKLTELTDINQIDIGLRTGIHGLATEFENEEYTNAITRLEESSNIIRPCEGDVPELLQNQLFEVLQQIGQEWLWIGDEFGTERKFEWIDDLKGDYSFPSHCKLFTPDKSLLVTTHWDSHFSFLCSTRETIQKILSINSFEGFFCNEKTEVYWSLRSPINYCT